MTTTELSDHLAQINPKNQVGPESNTIWHQIVLILSLMAASILVFTIGGYNYFMEPEVRTVVKCMIPVACLIATWVFYRSEKYHQYWKVSFAFLAVATGFLLAWFFGGWYSEIPGLIEDSVEGWALAKLAETLPIIGGVLLLAKLSGDNACDLHLKGGTARKPWVWDCYACPSVSCNLRWSVDSQ